LAEAPLPPPHPASDIKSVQSNSFPSSPLRDGESVFSHGIRIEYVEYTTFKLLNYLPPPRQLKSFSLSFEGGAGAVYAGVGTVGEE
jgi:hypothetical protein